MGSTVVTKLPVRLFLILDFIFAIIQNSTCTDIQWNNESDLSLFLSCLCYFRHLVNLIVYFNSALLHTIAQVCVTFLLWGRCLRYNASVQCSYSVCVLACIWRVELIIGTWKGSAVGSLGGEADARSRGTFLPLSFVPSPLSLYPRFSCLLFSSYKPFFALIYRRNNVDIEFCTRKSRD